MTALLSKLRARTERMVADLEALVAVESPSSDAEATSRCADAVAELGAALLDREPLDVVRDGRRHLWWAGQGEPRILLLGHFDTVWPGGTLARWPFAVRDGRATGPGVFDMKAGIVQGLHAVSMLDDPARVAVLFTSDEEIGSPTSRALVEEASRDAAAVLVLEPSAAGALKTGRKGVSMYHVAVQGRAAHAGLEPERGANALVELANQVHAVCALGDAAEGTSVTPSMAAAGTAVNVVPAAGHFDVDARALTAAEQQRVDDGMRALTARIPGTRLSVTGGPNRPPLDPAASRELFARAARVADELGIGPLGGVTVGGASDGNFAAGVGTPTLDGLGAVGDGAHAEGEHVLVSAMPERAALVAAVVAELLRG